MRSIEVTDISYIENEAYRAFRGASQPSGTSVEVILAIAVPVIEVVDVYSAFSAKVVLFGQLPLLKKCPTFPI